MNVAEQIAEWLEQNEICHAFGIIGAGNVALFDAISRRGFTKIICCHHEQAAAMAATYYYRTCGKLALVLVTTGAGSSNAITGVLAAWMDSIPLMVISGNEPTKFFDMPRPRVTGVQGFSSEKVMDSITKWSIQAKEHQVVLPLLNTLSAMTTHERPGPVWMDLPRDIQVQNV